jgi:hypothetical protein
VPAPCAGVLFEQVGTLGELPRNFRVSPPGTPTDGFLSVMTGLGLNPDASPVQYSYNTGVGSSSPVRMNTGDAFALGEDDMDVQPLVCRASQY